MSLLANSNAIEDAGYKIQRSLRFRSSASAYLSRTFGAATSTTTGTWSGWIKRGTLGVRQCIWSSSNYEFLRFMSSDAIEIAYLNNAGYVSTSAVFRDPSAWYHIVLVFDTTNATAANRMRLYVNGVQQTLNWGATPQTLNATFQRWNVNTYTGDIGDFQYNHTDIFDGYMAEVYWIDGQALTPSSFGQTDPVTGVWTPKKYTGTYGTNGFYLPFSDNTSATTLAYDKSGNGNNWTANNISTTAGATYDSMTDVPTLTSATAANYCVLNPLDKGTSVNVADGNLAYSVPTAASYGGVRGTLAITQKSYWEVTNTCGALPMFIGILNASVNVIGTADLFSVSGQATYRSSNGNKNINGTETAYGASNTTNDVIGVAYDPDTGELTFYKNGTSQGTISTGFTGYTYFPAVYDSTSSVCSAVFNFGQRPFSYTPPTGFKALNTFNLPDPTIKKPNQYVDATAWAGNSGAQSVTNSGFTPDFVWIKNRSNAYSHILQDSVRGVGKTLQSNTTNAEQANGVITSLDSSGFSLNNATGDNVGNLVGWQWKKGATPGFDIVTYTGNGTAGRTVSHSLGVAPAMIIVKDRSVVQDWVVYHSALGNTKAVFLDLTNAAATSSLYWNNTSPSSSVITLGSGDGTNKSGSNYVAYLFAEIAGFSKFGSYTGNGSADGPFVWTGFRPKYILVKRTDTSVHDWGVLDASRNPYNVITNSLQPNLSNTEYTGESVDFTSNGFKIRQTSNTWNGSGGTFIYAAFAESPFKYALGR